MRPIDQRIAEAEIALERLRRIKAKEDEPLRLTPRALKERRQATSERRPRWLPGDWSKEAPLRVLAMALLVVGLALLSRGVRQPSGCLLVGEWGGYSKTAAGPAHRVVLMLKECASLTGLVARHMCDRKNCIEPAHLLAGTSADNNRDTRERSQVKATRSKLPRFTTWEAWIAGDWKATDVPLVGDTEGVSDEIETVDLSLDHLNAIDSMTVAVTGPSEMLDMGNPDLWSEDDERCLQTSGWLDGHEPPQATRVAWVFSEMNGQRMPTVVPTARWVRP